MNGFVPFLPIFAAVVASAYHFFPKPGEPVTLKHLVTHPHGEMADPRVAAFVHGKASVPLSSHTLGASHHAKFFLLVPTLGADLTGGFVCSGTPGGLHPRRVTFVDPVFPGEHLLELVAFADCKTWFALNASFWHPELEAPTFKAAAFLRDKHGDWHKHALLPGVLSPFDDLTFFDFVKGRLHFELLPKLLEKLPSHPVTLALSGRVPKVVRKVVPKKPVELPPPSAPVLLDAPLLKGERVDDRLAFVVPAAVHHTHLSTTHTVRFVHLAPTLFGDVTGGFATPGPGAKPLPLPVTLPDFPEEHLVELVGFADCKTWFVLHLTFWHPGLGAETHRAAGFVKDDKGDWHKEALLPGPTPRPHGRTLVDFLHEKVHWELLPKLVKELPSHPLVHALAAKVH